MSAVTRPPAGTSTQFQTAGPSLTRAIDEVAAGRQVGEVEHRRELLEPKGGSARIEDHRSHTAAAAVVAEHLAAGQSETGALPSAGRPTYPTVTDWSFLSGGETVPLDERDLVRARAAPTWTASALP